MAIGSSNCDGRMVSHHLGTNHCHGLALSWIYLKSLHKNATFPGMIEEPGSFSGNDISPRPDLGPLPTYLGSQKLPPECHEWLMLQTICLMRTSKNKTLFFAVTNGISVRTEISAAISWSNPLNEFKP
ncbi:hypothetical protein DI09_10p480 [Mitosporidium daphniae]|uniref:Uncharacterized protein n=1 Tax=Mitosporidium daphniae TaxID=1485682 RepID=A0A098VZG8_9MICR|nr:uncharacterized protein DI09_10p480 [Mitosporidium daphniae]KGG53151.1 hypothetical protein DI09_10p480 [Mitosporidium daphniae]|eukprot:XP_013239578.1 uncharacterized protein DI09_10p480 [Mitosporidium daphniae]